MTDNSDKLKGVSSNQPKGTTSQTVFISDIISEGPIHGLVDGEASVFLNNTRIKDIRDAMYESLKEWRDITFSGGTTGTVSGGEWPDDASTPDSPEEAGEKWLRLYNTVEISGVTIDVTSSTNEIVTMELSKTAEDFSSIATGITGTKRVRIKKDNGSKIQGSQVWGTVNGSTFTSQVTDVADFDFSSTTFTLYLDEVFEISSITHGGSPSITTTSTPPSGTFAFAVGPREMLAAGMFTAGRSADKYENATVQFREGSLRQKPLSAIGGVGNSSIAGVISDGELKQVGSSPYPTTGYDAGNSADGVTRVINASGPGGNHFNLSQAQIQEVDQLRYSISYPSLVNVSDKSGNEYDATALYKVVLKITVDGETTPYVIYGDGQNADEPAPLKHTARTNGPISFGHSISLETFGPRDDFSLEITRLTRHQGRGVKTNGQDTTSRYRQSTVSTVTLLSAVITEKFAYPYTAYAGVTFSSREFDNLPQRSYHARGMKVLVPSNYTTREQATDGIADYSGVWNGSFKEEKEYTDNPAWIFYDILLNDRYGVGSWIDPTLINKYNLYRIARYCDELVDDGKGGVEPRFRANLYITKSTDVYKILKDMATIFMGIIYWMDGQITPVVDQPNDPVYNFTKSNVINGLFNYESTGVRTKVNQVVVSWNNPDNGYELQPLVVEDRNAIIDAGRIITQNAVAFGCTSEGQAMRFGRWKLWTAQNQTELVSFTSALNVGFIKPGDIVNVQDADRYAQKLSGRIVSQDGNSNPLTLTHIPLDRNITIENGYTYEIFVLITESSTILTQDTATIGTVVYNKGDVIATGQTEAQASTVLDDSSELVATAYNESTRVETGTVTNTAGTYDYLDLSANLSSLPQASSVWMVSETSVTEGLETAGSPKQYKVLSVAESSKNLYDIVAIEHYNIKYDAVEKDYSLGVVPDEVFPPKDDRSDVPEPQNVYLLRNSQHKWQGEELAIIWEEPDYDHIAGYEVYHDLEGVDNPISVPRDRRAQLLFNVPNGYHVFGVRTVATDGDRSKYVLTNLEVDDPFDANVPRTAGGMAKGAYSSSQIKLRHDPGVAPNVLEFRDTDYTIAPIQNPDFTFESNTSDADSYSISVNGIATQTSAGLDPLEAFLQSYFILFDASEVGTDDPYKIMQWDYLSLKNLYFWKEYGASTFNTLLGTVNVSAKSNKVRGTSTNFLTSVRVGDILKLSNDGFFAKGARVTAVIDDELLVIDRAFDEAVTSFSAQIWAYRPDYELDCIIARVWKPFGETKAKVVSFLNIDNNLQRPGETTAYYSASAPTNGSPYTLYEGDIWFDTNEAEREDQQHRWNGSTWEAIDYDPWNYILFNAPSAAATADGRVHLYIQDEEPTLGDLRNYDEGDTAFGEGDVWITRSLESYNYLSGSWTRVNNNLQSNSVYVQSSAPANSSLKEGDTWYDESNNLEQHVYTDGAWQSAGFLSTAGGDLDGTLWFVNQTTAASKYGIKADDFIGVNVLEVAPNVDNSSVAIKTQDTDSTVHNFSFGPNGLLALPDVEPNASSAIRKDFAEQNYAHKAYNTVADMVADSIVEGNMVTTEGYYSSGDGGGATYIIEGAGSADETLDHTLANSNVARLQTNGSINALQGGVTPDDVDRGAEIDAVEARAETDGLMLTYPKGTYNYYDLLHHTMDGTHLTMDWGYDHSAKLVNGGERRIIQIGGETDASGSLLQGNMVGVHSSVTVRGDHVGVGLRGNAYDEGDGANQSVGLYGHAAIVNGGGFGTHGETLHGGTSNSRALSAEAASYSASGTMYGLVINNTTLGSPATHTVTGLGKANNANSTALYVTGNNSGSNPEYGWNYGIIFRDQALNPGAPVLQTENYEIMEDGTVTQAGSLTFENETTPSNTFEISVDDLFSDNYLLISSPNNGSGIILQSRGPSGGVHSLDFTKDGNLELPNLLTVEQGSKGYSMWAEDVLGVNTGIIASGDNSSVFVIKARTAGGADYSYVFGMDGGLELPDIEPSANNAIRKDWANANFINGDDRTINTGDGLSGGGDLSQDRTFTVDGTVVRTGGAQTIAGVKTFNDLPESDGTTPTTANQFVTKGWVESGLALFYVPVSRTITSGNGLTGGGDLSANRTLNVGAGDGITVNANDIEVNYDSDYFTVSGGELTVSTFGVVTTSASQSISGQKTFNDNVLLRFGTGGDCELFCNGSHMYMDLNSGIGNFYIRDGSTTRFTFDDAGAFTATGNITANSDITLKHNISPIEGAMHKIRQLGGYIYDRTDLKVRQTGVIAQEVDKVLPELVTRDEHGILSVAYGNFAGLFIEGIKEQDHEIKDLQARVAQLETLIQELLSQ